MLNSQKFKTAEERALAYEKFCSGKNCDDCILMLLHCKYSVDTCLAFWLDLEAEEEKPLPCPFCGSNTAVAEHDTVRHVNNYWIECTNCNYRSEEKYQRDAAIAAHNSVARAVMEARKKGNE